MEKEQITKLIQKRLCLEDKEFQPIKDSPKFQRLFDNLATGSRYKLVAEVVESKGCHSGHVKGQKLVFDSSGNLLTREAPERVCAFLMPHLTVMINTFFENILNGRDPNEVMFNRTGCYDVARAAVGWQKLRLDPRARTVSLLVPNMRLDLGSIAKGYAADQALEILKGRGMERALSIAVALDPAIDSRIKKGPTKDYFREYQRTNALLSDLAHRAGKLLQECGFAAIALEPTTEEFDAVRLRAGLSHKIAATRSGLGWIGKNALVITEAYGSAVRLTTVLTDAALGTGTPFDESRCGTCTACVEICPAKAPTGTNWRLGRYRDDFFDAWACCRKATEFCEREGIGSTICGICIEACPWTRKYLKRTTSQEPRAAGQKT